MPEPIHQSLLAGFRRRKIPAIFFLFPIFCLALVGIAWYEVSTRIDREYQMEIDSIHRESDNLARSLEDYVRRNMQAVDDTLLFLKLRYENQGQLTPDMLKYIQTRRSLLMEEIYVVDTKGMILTGSPISKMNSLACACRSSALVAVAWSTS